MGVNCSHFPFSFLPREKVNLTANIDQLYGNCWLWELGIILEMPSIYTDLPSKRTRWECGSWAGVCDWVQMGVTQWELIGPRAPTIVRAAPSSSTGSSIWSWIDCPPCWLATIVAGLPPLGLPGCPPWWYGVVGGQWCHHRLGFQLNQEAIRQSDAWQPEDLNQLTFDIINNNGFKYLTLTRPRDVCQGCLPAPPSSTLQKSRLPCPQKTSPAPQKLTEPTECSGVKLTVDSQTKTLFTLFITRTS